MIVGRLPVPGLLSLFLPGCEMPGSQPFATPARGLRRMLEHPVKLRGNRDGSEGVYDRVSQAQDISRKITAILRKSQRIEAA